MRRSEGRDNDVEAYFLGFSGSSRLSGEGHLELARLLLVEGGAIAAGQDKGRRTPLHWASGEGYVKPARLLIEHGANATAPDKRGRTPLHWASEKGYIELAQLLLVEHGADAAAQDKGGRTPPHWASEKGHVELAGYPWLSTAPMHQPGPRTGERHCTWRLKRIIWGLHGSSLSTAPMQQLRLYRDRRPTCSRQALVKLHYQRS